jgi:hypothetical protein
MAANRILPPSLSRMRSAPAPNESKQERLRREHADAPIERENEREKKQAARERSLAAAIRSLTGNPEPFVSAFESTYYAVKRNDRPATAARVEKQLTITLRKCANLNEHLSGIHPDVVQALAWSPIAIWQVSEYLNEMAGQASIALKAKRRAAKRGNPGNAMAAAMTEAAAFVYTQLTGKPANQGTKKGSLEVFLGEIFDAYGIKANPQHCIRELKASFGGNSKQKI